MMITLNRLKMKVTQRNLIKLTTNQTQQRSKKNI